MRIIDANANRAREALRVMEEAARFHLDDARLTDDLKTLRHDFARALAPLDGLWPHRDTPGDVGTALTAEGERTRESIAHVASAAGKRLSEAMRAIEEYGKVIDPSFAASIDSLRYRGYELERRLNARLIGSRARQWALCFLLTESLCPHGWRATLEQAIEGGADCIQVREKDMDDHALLERAREVVRIGRARGVSVIVNDRPDIALLAGADGVHLGQGDLPADAVRRLVGREAFIGVSTSTIDEAKRAVESGAAYCGVGPMFATSTKVKDRVAGPSYLREYIDRIPLPHLAIGGVNGTNLGQLSAAGCRGVAVCAAIAAAPDPRKAARALREAIDAAASRRPTADRTERDHPAERGNANPPALH